jgi:putative oxidoreductase
MTKQTDAFALAGRFLIAVMFFMSGFGKVVEPAATIAAIKAVGLPMPPVSYAISIIVELGSALLLVLGWQTRLVGAVLSGFCIVTALTVHKNVSDPNQLFHFLKNIAITGGLFQLIAFGAGKYSLDARRAASGSRE